MDLTTSNFEEKNNTRTWILFRCLEFDTRKQKEKGGCLNDRKKGKGIVYITTSHE